MKSLALPFALLTLSWIPAACAGPEEDTAATAAATEPAQGTAQVVVQNIAFMPESLTVLRGTEVTWTSADANVRHTATSGVPGEREVPGVTPGTDAKTDGVFDGDLPDAGAEFSFTFDEAGTYPYFCEVHPSMTAEIVVE